MFAILFSLSLAALSVAACPTGKFGSKCQYTCGRGYCTRPNPQCIVDACDQPSCDCSDHGQRSPTFGTCSCDTGYAGRFCELYIGAVQSCGQSIDAGVDITPMPTGFCDANGRLSCINGAANYTDQMVTSWMQPRPCYPPDIGPVCLSPSTQSDSSLNQVAFIEPGTTDLGLYITPPGRRSPFITTVRQPQPLPGFFILRRASVADARLYTIHVASNRDRVIVANATSLSVNVSAAFVDLPAVWIATFAPQGTADWRFQLQEDPSLELSFLRPASAAPFNIRLTRSSTQPFYWSLYSDLIDPFNSQQISRASAPNAIAPAYLNISSVLSIHTCQCHCDRDLACGAATFNGKTYTCSLFATQTPAMHFVAAPTYVEAYINADQFGRRCDIVEWGPACEPQMIGPVRLLIDGDQSPGVVHGLAIGTAAAFWDDRSGNNSRNWYLQLVQPYGSEYIIIPASNQSQLLAPLTPVGGSVIAVTTTIVVVTTQAGTTQTVETTSVRVTASILGSLPYNRSLASSWFFNGTFGLDSKFDIIYAGSTAFSISAANMQFTIGGRNPVNVPEAVLLPALAHTAPFSLGIDEIDPVPSTLVPVGYGRHYPLWSGKASFLLSAVVVMVQRLSSHWDCYGLATSVLNATGFWFKNDIGQCYIFTGVVKLVDAADPLDTSWVFNPVLYNSKFFNQGLACTGVELDYPRYDWEGAPAGFYNKVGYNNDSCHSPEINYAELALSPSTSFYSGSTSMLHGSILMRTDHPYVYYIFMWTCVGKSGNCVNETNATASAVVWNGQTPVLVPWNGPLGLAPVRVKIMGWTTSIQGTNTWNGCDPSTSTLLEALDFPGLFFGANLTLVPFASAPSWTLSISQTDCGTCQQPSQCSTTAPLFTANNVNPLECHSFCRRWPANSPPNPANPVVANSVLCLGAVWSASTSQCLGIGSNSGTSALANNACTWGCA